MGLTELPAGVRRVRGWERRLNEALAAAGKKPYRFGEHDCYRVALAALEALTGIDLWPGWAGMYTTPFEALRRMHEYGGAGFDEAFSRLFGAAALRPVKRAKRGDMVKVLAADGAPHLGVCIGALVCGLREEGMAYARLATGECFWPIGREG